MVYYKSTNRFWCLPTDLHTCLDGLLTDLHTGLNGVLTDLHTVLNCLLQIHKPVYKVYYKPTKWFSWFTNWFTYQFKPFTTIPQTSLHGLLTDLQTGLSGLLTDLHTGLYGLLTDLHTSLNALLQNHEQVFLVY